MIISDILQLNLAKYLIFKAEKNILESNPLKYTAILNIHDAIELVNSACLNHNCLKIEYKFMKNIESLCDIYPELNQYRNILDKLNKDRVNLKHNGTLPSDLNLKNYIIMGSSYATDLCHLALDKDINDVDLVDFIKSGTLRDDLKQSKLLFEDNNIDDTKELLKSIFIKIVSKSKANKILNLFTADCPVSYYDTSQRYIHDILSKLFDTDDGSINQIVNELSSKYHFMFQSISNIRIYLILKDLKIDIDDFINFIKYIPLKFPSYDRTYDLDITSGHFDFIIDREKKELDEDGFSYCYNFLIKMILSLEST